MNRKRIFALAFAVLMVLALAACGTKNNDKMGDMSGNGSAMTGEPKNAEEASFQIYDTGTVCALREQLIGMVVPFLHFIRYFGNGRV